MESQPHILQNFYSLFYGEYKGTLEVRESVSQGGGAIFIFLLASASLCDCSADFFTLFNDSYSRDSLFIAWLLCGGCGLAESYFNRVSVGFIEVEFKIFQIFEFLAFHFLNFQR